MNRKVDFWGGVCIALLAVCTACFSLIYVKSHHAVCFSLAITSGTFTYHTAMRFAVGWVVGRHRVPVNPQGSRGCMRTWGSSGGSTGCPPISPTICTAICKRW